MYATHQAQIMRHVARKPEHTRDVLRFVLFSIRRHLEHVGPLMRDPDPRVMQLTRRGLDYVDDNYIDLHVALQAPGTDEDKMLRVLQVPGLGIVKSGFVLQLACGRVGCLDSHNLKMYGVSAKDFRADVTYARLCANVRQYIAVCQRLGGTAQLWDAWCSFVARERPRVWRDAEAVSQYHVDCIKKGSVA